MTVTERIDGYGSIHLHVRPFITSTTVLGEMPSLLANAARSLACFLANARISAMLARVFFAKAALGILTLK